MTGPLPRRNPSPDALADVGDDFLDALHRQLHGDEYLFPQGRDASASSAARARESACEAEVSAESAVTLDAEADAAADGFEEEVGTRWFRRRPSLLAYALAAVLAWLALPLFPEGYE